MLYGTIFFTNLFGEVEPNAVLPFSRSGGEGGIRTRDTLLRYTHFPGVLLRPLGHFSFSLSPPEKLVLNPYLPKGAAMYEFFPNFPLFRSVKSFFDFYTIQHSRFLLNPVSKYPNGISGCPLRYLFRGHSV